MADVHRVLMNPLVAYDWCDFYFGNEVGRWLRDPFAEEPQEASLEPDAFMSEA